MKVPLIVLACAGMVLVAGCLDQSRTQTARPPAGGGPGTGGGGPTHYAGNETLPPAAAAQNLTGGYDLRGEASVGAFWNPHNVTARFIVTNVGDSAMRIGELCDSPWEFQVRNASGAVVPHEPMRIRCMAASYPVEFPAGASLRFNTSWNGTLYDSENHARLAPPGDYSLVATFTAWRGDETTRIALALPVQVWPPEG